MIYFCNTLIYFRSKLRAREEGIEVRIEKGIQVFFGCVDRRLYDLLMSCNFEQLKIHPQTILLYANSNFIDQLNTTSSPVIAVKLLILKLSSCLL